MCLFISVYAEKQLARIKYFLSTPICIRFFQIIDPFLVINVNFEVLNRVFSIFIHTILNFTANPRFVRVYIFVYESVVRSGACGDIL